MKILPPLLFFTSLLLLWQYLVFAGVWPHYLVPAPTQVASYLIHNIWDGTLIFATLVTLKRLLLGYLFSIAIGIPLGLMTARYLFLEQTLGILALGLQTLPSICWAPLAILWFGQTESAMFFIVVMGSIWSILLATASGVQHVPPLYIRAAETMGSRGCHTWIHVILPASLPFIVSGMKQGWAFAWRSLMAAEIYVTIITGFGLGNLLHYDRELNAMDGVLAIMIVIILIGLSVDRIFFNPLEQYLHKRWGTIRRMI